MSKRKKPDTPDALLESPIEQGTILLLKHRDKEEGLRNVSPFLIEKCLTAAIKGHPPSVKRLRSGNVQIEVRSREQAEKLIKIEHLNGEIPISVIFHPTLNHGKAVLRTWQVAQVTEEELQNELASQGVLLVKKLTKEIKANHPPAFLLTFSSKEAPSHVTFFYEKHQLAPYYPSPLRCYHCQQYGHRTPCNRPQVCPRCATTHDGSHDEKECTNNIKCTACKSTTHDVRSSSCPKYVNEMKSLRLSYKENIPVPTARKFVKTCPQGTSVYRSYSAAARKENNTEIEFPPLEGLNATLITPSQKEQPVPLRNPSEDASSSTMENRTPAVSCISPPKVPKNSDACETCKTILPNIAILTTQVSQLINLVHRLIEKITPTLENTSNIKNYNTMQPTKKSKKIVSLKLHNKTEDTKEGEIMLEKDAMDIETKTINDSTEIKLAVPPPNKNTS